MPLKVIGAGLPRTGTNSLQIALDQLGFGPCHHMRELIEDASQRPLWLRVYEGHGPDWEDVFKGYSAAVDAPAAFLWRALSAAYPSAKVILTTRSPEGWRRSMLAAGAAVQANPPEPQWGAFMQKSLEFFVKLSPAMLPPDDASAFAAFKAHNEAVKREIAPERLLVFDVREGWAPLCRFLGVSEPETPFPHKNTGEDFAELYRKRADAARSGNADIKREKETK